MYGRCLWLFSVCAPGPDCRASKVSGSQKDLIALPKANVPDKRRPGVTCVTHIAAEVEAAYQG